jgi:hypothetical protein
VNDINQFSYDPSIAFDNQLFSDLKLKYNIFFPKRLIQINLPKSFSRDYLACVILYHELGHFIDLSNSCSEALAQDFYQRIQSDKDLLIWAQPFFPIINNSLFKISESDRRQIIQLHFGEYFCDLFASQYVGPSLNDYLYFITQGDANFSFTHPSTINRVKLVNDFLSGRENHLVDFIKDGVEQMINNSLRVRFEQISSQDFYNLLPIDIHSIPQLHGVFNFGWQIWQNDWKPFAEKMKMEASLSSNQVYSIINNLMEKSIGNFIVTKQWKETRSI